MLNKIIANAISAVLALGITGTATAADMAPPQGGEKCYGVAKAGLNDCATSKHNCSGEAKLDGAKEEWITVPAGTCNKIVGGKTTG